MELDMFCSKHILIYIAQSSECDRDIACRGLLRFRNDGTTGWTRFWAYYKIYSVRNDSGGHTG